MKIILASCSETTNRQLSVVLAKLGYSVDGYMDHFWKHHRQWNKILTVGGCSDDFIDMYSDVDVVMEIPALFFWKEILDAFPNSKIIITRLDSDDLFDGWYRFIRSTKRGGLYRYIHLISPTGWKFLTFRQNVFRFLNLDLSFVKPHLPLPTNKMLLSRLIRQHRADIDQQAPKDQVFVYDPSEGWEPICEFLGVKVPQQAYPDQASDEEIVEKSSCHPVLRRIRTESAVFSVLFLSVSWAGLYFLKQSWNKVQWSIIKHVVKVWYKSH